MSLDSIRRLFRAYTLGHPFPSSRKAEAYVSLSAATVAALALALAPPVTFEKYTFYLYVTRSAHFFTYSGWRVWFDIIWFVCAGAASTLIVGRRRKISVIPPVIAAFFFTLIVYVEPLCQPAECYISSTDGFGAVRDFLLFCSLGFLAANAALSRETLPSKSSLGGSAYALISSVLLGYALGFFPLFHIFAGVTVAYPYNYLQWFLAAAPPAFAGALRVSGVYPTMRNPVFAFACGMLGLLLGILLGFQIPCEACSGYPLVITSIITVGAAFSLLGSFAGSFLGLKARFNRDTLMQVTIVAVVLLLLAMFIFPNYQMSLVNEVSGASPSAFSPLEVGHAFVYGGGYLSIPYISTLAVGVSVSFGNTSISQSPPNFLAAGVGDQSPNCCKDGLDLAYRADVSLFFNGTEAALARAWWACDENMACTGYSWQQLLHYGAKTLPHGALSNQVELEMNWTANYDVAWFYRIHYLTNGSAGPWVEYSFFVPPKIQNHYFDAGLFVAGNGNHPSKYAYFYQFGVSSAYPIESTGWQVDMSCPKLVINSSWECIPSAGFISGDHSFWKVLYTFGETYTGLAFSYLGNYSVEFHYGGASPQDDATIW